MYFENEKLIQQIKHYPNYELYLQDKEIIKTIYLTNLVINEISGKDFISLINDEVDNNNMINDINIINQNDWEKTKKILLISSMILIASIVGSISIAVFGISAIGLGIPIISVITIGAVSWIAKLIIGEVLYKITEKAGLIPLIHKGVKNFTSLFKPEPKNIEERFNDLKEGSEYLKALIKFSFEKEIDLKFFKTYLKKQKNKTFETLWIKFTKIWEKQYPPMVTVNLPNPNNSNPEIWQASTANSFNDNFVNNHSKKSLVTINQTKALVR